MAWHELEQFLLEQAAEDLLADGEIRPRLAAFAGKQPLFLALLRPFTKGAYADPVIELLALALALAADRVTFAAGGRAWSLEDPIAPVVEGVGDLRQRVVAITSVDGAGEHVVRASSLHAFHLRPDEVEWGAVLRERAESWIGDALETAVLRRHDLVADLAAARSQATRCAELGHLVAFHSVIAERLRTAGEVTASRG